MILLFYEYPAPVFLLFHTLILVKCCCAIKVVIGNVSFVLINVYLPTDNYSANVDNEMRDTVDCIETFIYSLTVDFIVFAGDLNMDLTRANAHCRFVAGCLVRVNMSICTNFLSHNITFTRKCND